MTTTRRKDSLLITRAETMALLQCGEKTFTRWAGKLKLAKLGHNFVRADVEAKIAALVKEQA